MVDAAVLSVTRAEVEAMVEKHLYGAKALSSIKKRITRAVVVIVVLTNTINVLGPIIVGYLAVKLYGSAIIGIITAVLTFGTIVFSEIIPKSLGSHYAPLISRIVAPTIRAFVWLLFPFVILLEWLTGMFKTGHRKVGTEDQIRSLVRLGRMAGHIESDEGQLIHRAFVLNDRTASDVMTPLNLVKCVSAENTVIEAAQTVLKNPFSRYPMYGETADDILGIVISHDILQALSEGKDEQSIRTLSRTPLLVESDMHCDDLLELFRSKHMHLAIVREEDMTIGVVTLEDVLEELVGEIEDDIEAYVRLQKEAVGE